MEADEHGSGSSQPHDALIRELLGDPENASSELRSILPDNLVAQLDLNNLTLQPGTFIDDDLHHSHVDLLFQTTANGRDAYLYVLIEHQSTPDPHMTYRMYAYHQSSGRGSSDDYRTTAHRPRSRRRSRRRTCRASP